MSANENVIKDAVEPRHGTDNVFFALIPTAAAGTNAIGIRDEYLPQLGQNPYLVPKECLHISLLDISTRKNLSSRPIASTICAAKTAAGQLQIEIFDVLFQQALSFGKTASAIPFVLQMSQGKERVQALCEKLKFCLAAAGVHSEDKAKTPHLTLARAQNSIAAVDVGPIGWTAVSLVLVLSVVGETRHVYLESWPLKAH